MNDRDALAAALEVFRGYDEWMKAETSPNSVGEIELAEAMRLLAAAARERLAQLPAHVVGSAGRPQEYDEPTINWNVRFPVSLHTRLQTAALERGRSMTRIVQVAVADHLDAEEQRTKGSAKPADTTEGGK